MKHDITNDIFTRIPWMPTSALIQNAPGERSPRVYADVIDQFKVETNPRYAPRDGKTYCNIFVWDVTRAMGAEIPHWGTDDGSAANPVTPRARRMNVNAMWQWLREHGAKHGWQQANPATALNAARMGRPTVAILPDFNDHGHIAVVRPGDAMTLAQAGARRFLRGALADSFGEREPEFWLHE